MKTIVSTGNRKASDGTAHRAKKCLLREAYYEATEASCSLRGASDLWITYKRTNMLYLVLL